jgi:hypothetical protein
MNTHSDGLYGTLITLCNNKDFGLKLESAMPAVDQPIGEVDEREVDKMVCLHFTITSWSTAAMLPLLLCQTS